jgi:hypothetical protein
MKIKFMSIPKTASVSFTAFTDANNMPKVAHDRDTILSRPWREMLHADCDKIMCVLRDPLDRLVSAYSYMSTGGTNPADEADRETFLAGYTCLEDFIMGGGLFDAAVGQMHFHPQVNWLFDIQGRVPVDKLIPIDFHNMEESLESACGDYGLTYIEIPHHNSSKRINETLSEEAMEIVEEIYAADYKLIRRVFDL